MIDQRSISDMGGTMRLGLYPCILQKGTKAAEAYGVPQVEERHRHGETVSVVNSLTVFDFDTEGRIRHLDVFLQQGR